EVVNNLRGEVGLTLLDLALVRDIFEPQCYRRSGITISGHDPLDAEGAPFDLHVDGAVLVAVHEEILKPATLAADRARAGVQPILGVAAERRIEGTVLPFHAAMIVDDRDRH